MSQDIGSVGIQVLARTDGLEANMRGAAQVFEAQMRRIKSASTIATDSLSRIQAAAAGFKANDEVKKAAGHMDELSFKSVGARRELLVLAHEASQGNWSKFGGSLMVLGERVDAMSLIFSKGGLAIGAMAAALGIVIAGIVTGHTQSVQFNHDIQATGNYAGVTAGQFDSLADSISQVTNVSSGKSRDALQGLLGTGRVGSADTMKSMAASIVQLEKLTGASSDEMVKDFSKMGDGVAKWAEEHNKSYHFLTSEQYAYIATLEEQGKKEAAMQATSEALYQHIKDSGVENLGLLEKAWRSLGSAAHGVWDWLQAIGRDSTPEAAIDKLQAKADNLRKSIEMAAHGSMQDSVLQRELAETEAQISDQLAIKKAFEAEATKKSADAKKAESAIAAQGYLKNLHEELDTRTKLTRELEKYRQQVTALKGTQQEVSASQQAKDEAALRKKYAAPESKALDNAYTTTYNKLGEEGAKLDAQIAQFKKYGDAVNHAREATLDFDIAQGKLKGLSKSQIDALRDLARGDDEKASQLDALKTADSIQKKVQAIQAEANARDQTARATEEAALMSELDRVKSKLSADAYDQLAKSIREAVNARADARLGKTLQEQSRQTDDEIRKLAQDTQLIGANTMERQKAAATLKMQAEAQKLIEQNPDNATQILDSLAADNDRLTAAIEKNYAAQRSWSSGWESAWSKYKESATDSASAAAGVFQSMTSGMEDALVSLATTGKADFASLANSIISDIIRITARLAIMQALGDGGGGTGLGAFLGSAFGSMFGSGSSAAAAAPATVPSVGEGFFYAATGTNYVERDNSPYILHKGEAVVPAAYNPAAGGIGSGVEVRIVESPGNGGKTSQRQQNGKTIIDVMVEAVKSALMGDIAYGGDFSHAMEGKYGLSRSAGSVR